MIDIAFISKLYSAVETANSLKGFIQDEMSNLLRQIGESEYQAAIRALDDSKLSKDSPARINSAINHLESAYELFLRASKSKLLDSWLFMLHLEANRRAPNLFRAYRTALLIAVCYHYLEDDLVKEKYLKEAEECVRKYSNVMIKDAKGLVQRQGAWAWQPVLAERTSDEVKLLKQITELSEKMKKSRLDERHLKDSKLT